MMIYMILITKLADLLMLDAIFLQSVAFTFSFDHSNSMALILITLLYERKLINKETFENIIRHKGNNSLITNTVN